ncbi:MAG TPA: phosphoribosyl-AMP cyclohydrolase [Candidatus Bathyarchaeia archaeon]|nr:phosphoribosyl-AMP cyclohydrolase [Candidatus Bathyarchaeia archaeon]
MEAPDFSKGLVPAIAQDWQTGEILMLAYMNEAAWQETLATRRACYFSRSRGLWHKGEESGHFQEVHDILIDCDRDTIVLRVRQHGGAACHTGYRSCFFRRLGTEDWEITQERVFDPAQVYKKPHP